jgi:hypothetical protein
VADRDLVFADQDFADEQPDDLLALLDGQILGVGSEPRAEAFECLGELEVGLGVVQLGVKGIQLGLQGRLALAQLGRAGPQLIEGHELLLVAVQQPAQRGLRAGEIALQRVATPGGRVGGAHRLQPAVDLGLDQGRVLQQSEHATPDELVDLGEADGPVLADASLRATVTVGA